jgi:hypothetical protein
MINYAYKEGSMDKDNNLSMYCFLVINTLIEYSSHDKQDKFAEIIEYFISQFDNTLLTTGNNLNTDILFQLQSYYCTVFKTIFRKYLRKLNVETANKIYTRIEASFKQRQGVYDEALLTISALATNIGEDFESIMDQFQEYLAYALKKFNESTLCKAAILTVGEIVRAIRYNFHKYSDKIIPIIIEILTNDDVSRYNKTVAITTLGEICMAINKHFLPYLDTVMQLLISAASMASTKTDEVLY